MAWIYDHGKGGEPDPRRAADLMVKALSGKSLQAVEQMLTNSEACAPEIATWQAGVEWTNSAIQFITP